MRAAALMVSSPSAFTELLPLTAANAPACRTRFAVSKSAHRARPCHLPFLQPEASSLQPRVPCPKLHIVRCLGCPKALPCPKVHMVHIVA